MRPAGEISLSKPRREPAQVPKPLPQAVELATANFREFYFHALG
jgi:hypothetical protein